MNPKLEENAPVRLLPEITHSNDSCVSIIFVKSAKCPTSATLNVPSTSKVAPTSPTTLISGMFMLPSA